MNQRLTLLIVSVVAFEGIACGGRRCEAARREAVPAWQYLQTEVAQRLAQARDTRSRYDDTDAGEYADEARQAQAHLAQVEFWAQRVSNVSQALQAPRDAAFASSMRQWVAEASESIHGVNDADLNQLLAPARLSALNVIAACSL